MRKLLHADAFITTTARAPLYKLQPECYAQCDQTWGVLPVLVLGGDELQVPPVLMEASLLAPVEGTSDEHKAGCVYSEAAGKYTGSRQQCGSTTTN